MPGEKLIQTLIYIRVFIYISIKYLQNEPPNSMYFYTTEYFPNKP